MVGWWQSSHFSIAAYNKNNINNSQIQPKGYIAIATEKLL